MTRHSSTALTADFTSLKRGGERVKNGKKRKRGEKRRRGRAEERGGEGKEERKKLRRKQVWEKDEKERGRRRDE